MSAAMRAGVALVAVFALGTIAGVFYERHYGERTVTTSTPSSSHDAAMSELRNDVGLDDEQIAQVHEILARHHDVVERSWRQLRPEVQNAIRQVHVDIADILRPEQRERFHSWLQRRRQQLHRELEGVGGPPPSAAPTAHEERGHQP